MNRTAVLLVVFCLSGSFVYAQSDKNANNGDVKIKSSVPKDFSEVDEAAEVKVPDTISGRVVSFDREKGAVIVKEAGTEAEYTVQVDSRTLMELKQTMRVRITMRKDKWEADRVFIYDLKKMFKQADEK